MSENMNREQAETVTREIRDHGKTLTVARTKFASAIKRAKSGRAHEALGYASWSAYVAHVFGDMPGLGQADAEYLCAFMAGEGMSSRAVARVLGVSQSTAARMIRKAEEVGDVDAKRTVEGVDGVAQSKGAGKGRKSGGSAKPAAAEAPVEARTLSVKQAKTEELRALAIQIAGELSDRWAEGDEAAELAIREIGDAVMTLA